MLGYNVYFEQILEMKKRYRNIDWEALKRTRNITNHSYLKVDPRIIEKIIISKVIPIKKEILRAIKENDK